MFLRWGLGCVGGVVQSWCVLACGTFVHVMQTGPGNCFFNFPFLNYCFVLLAPHVELVVLVWRKLANPSPQVLRAEIMVERPTARMHVANV